jgi:hypothetical protein
MYVTFCLREEQLMLLQFKLPKIESLSLLLHLPIGSDDLDVLL